MATGVNMPDALRYSTFRGIHGYEASVVLGGEIVQVKRSHGKPPLHMC